MFEKLMIPQWRWRLDTYSIFSLLFQRNKSSFKVSWKVKNELCKVRKCLTCFMTWSLCFDAHICLRKNELTVGSNKCLHILFPHLFSNVEVTIWQEMKWKESERVAKEERETLRERERVLTTPGSFFMKTWSGYLISSLEHFFQKMSYCKSSINCRSTFIYYRLYTRKCNIWEKIFSNFDSSPNSYFHQETRQDLHDWHSFHVWLSSCLSKFPFHVLTIEVHRWRDSGNWAAKTCPYFPDPFINFGRNSFRKRG